jgi:shikimate kinase
MLVNSLLMRLYIKNLVLIGKVSSGSSSIAHEVVNTLTYQHLPVDLLSYETL